MVLKVLSSCEAISRCRSIQVKRKREGDMQIVCCSNGTYPLSVSAKWLPNKKGGDPVGQVKFLQKLAPPLVAALVTLSPLCITPVSLGQTLEIQRGASLFGQSCIGCHDAGGNVIQPGATLFSKDLERNGVDTEEEIYRVTYFGKGRMPGFGEKCTPRGQCTFGPRLQEEDIQLLAKFVKLQAEQGWPRIESSQD